MKRFALFVLLGFASLLMAMTVFAQSVWAGPILMTIALFSSLYSLFCLYQEKPKWGQTVVEFIANLLIWP